jgi:hypothetical protein
VEDGNMNTEARLTAGLDERIAAAFGPGTNSGAVADLIAEAEAAALSSGDWAEAARTRALDPALSPADVIAARHDMEDAAFRRDRMQEAVRRLGERLREVRRQEEQARRRVAYDAALAERDALATEFAAVYPALAEQLADIVGRIAANDALLERVNRKRPDGEGGLVGAEQLARGLSGYSIGVSNVPRITAQLRLPAFRYSGTDPYAWPRPGMLKVIDVANAS